MFCVVSLQKDAYVAYFCTKKNTHATSVVERTGHIENNGFLCALAGTDEEKKHVSVNKASQHGPQSGGG